MQSQKKKIIIEKILSLNPVFYYIYDLQSQIQKAKKYTTSKTHCYLYFQVFGVTSAHIQLRYSHR